MLFNKGRYCTERSTYHIVHLFIFFCLVFLSFFWHRNFSFGNKYGSIIFSFFCCALFLRCCGYSIFFVICKRFWGGGMREMISGIVFS
jgi:hypothetical protein